MPTYDAGVQAQGGGRIVQLPVQSADTGMGEALSQAGRAAMEIADRAKQAQLDDQLVHADRTVREGIDRAKFALQTNMDVPDDQLRSNLRTSTDALVAEAGKGIGSDLIRRRWSEKTGALQADADLWANNLGLTRTVDRAKGAIIASSAQLGDTAGDLGIAPETYAKNIEEQRARIDREKARGFLNAESAATINAQLDDYVRKDKFSRTLATVRDLSEQGRYDDATKLIPGATTDGKEREALSEAIKTVQRDKRAAQVAAEAEVRKQQDDIHDRIQVGVLQGQMSEASINKAAQDGKINAGQQASLIQAQRSYVDWVQSDARLSPEQKAARDVRSSVARADLINMDPARFVSGRWTADEQADFQSLRPDDQKAVLNEIQKRKNASDGPDLPAGNYNKMLAYAKMAAPEISWNASVNNKDKNKQNTAKNRLGVPLTDAQIDNITGMKKALLDAAQSASTSGKPMDDRDVKNVVHNALRSFGGPLTGPRPADVQNYDVVPPGFSRSSVSRDEYDQTESLMRRRMTRPPTPTEVYAEIATRRADEARMAGNP